MHRILCGREEALLAKMMMASLEQRQERTRWYLREIVWRRSYMDVMESKVKKIGWVRRERLGGAGQALPTSSHRWRGRAGSNLCFRESNMVVGGGEGLE